MSTALREAIRLYRDPSVLRLLAKRPLPDGVDLLLNVAAGAAPSPEGASPWGEVSPEELRTAARFYVARILFDGSSDDFRMFGSNEPIDLEHLKLSRRLLLRWLHPDTTRDPDATSLFIRMNEAWDRIRSGSARIAPKLPVIERVPSRDAPTRYRRGFPPMRKQVGRKAPRLRKTKVVIVVAAFAAIFLGLTLVIDTMLEKRRCPAMLSSIPLCAQKW